MSDIQQKFPWYYSPYVEQMLGIYGNSTDAINYKLQFKGYDEIIDHRCPELTIGEVHGKSGSKS